MQVRASSSARRFCHSERSRGISRCFNAEDYRDVSTPLDTARLITRRSAGRVFSHSRGDRVGDNMSPRFFPIAIWLSPRCATFGVQLQSDTTYANTFGRLGEGTKARVGRPLIFATSFRHTNVTLILLPIRLRIRTFTPDHACRR